jgi:hypothetical protein
MIAAYIVATLIILGYTISLAVRVRRETRR